MPVAISFGIAFIEDGMVSTNWDGELPEEDGCDQERLYPGCPRRVISNIDFHFFLELNPPIKALFEKWHWTWATGAGQRVTEWTLADIEAIEDLKREGDNDRLRWMRYWAKRAREEYSDDAYIAVN